MVQRLVATVLAALPALSLSGCQSEPTSVMPAEEATEFTHGYADNNGVKIHYAQKGDGPLVVMIHGFPDFWYSWRHQMDGLQDGYRVVAIDQRGYNLSDKPEGVENYDMRLLVSDVVAVVRHLGEEKATIVGHDWGGAVAWYVAGFAPEVVENLVVLNLPHPNGMLRAMQDNARALEGTNYTKAFREGSPDDPDVLFGNPMTPETLSFWVTDANARPKYIEAFKRSDFTAMLNYYKRNYPDTSALGKSAPPTIPRITASTLVFHGLNDTALHSDGLNNTWDWIESDVTIVTVPGAGHFVQQDAADLVTKTLRSWLDDRNEG